MRLEGATSEGTTAVLVVGDVVALLVFTLVGLSSHSMDFTAGNIVRIAAPLFVGWFAAALLFGALSFRGTRGAFLLRSALTWLVGIGVGLVIRGLVLSWQDVPPVFIAVTYVFTAIFLLGWRSLFALVFKR